MGEHTWHPHWPPDILKESHVLAHTSICHTPMTNTNFSLNIPKDKNLKDLQNRAECDRKLKLGNIWNFQIRLDYTISQGQPRQQSDILSQKSKAKAKPTTNNNFKKAFSFHSKKYQI